MTTDNLNVDDLTLNTGVTPEVRARVFERDSSCVITEMLERDCDGMDLSKIPRPDPSNTVHMKEDACHGYPRKKSMPQLDLDWNLHRALHFWHMIQHSDPKWGALLTRFLKHRSDTFRPSNIDEIKQAGKTQRIIAKNKASSKKKPAHKKRTVNPHMTDEQRKAHDKKKAKKDGKFWGVAGPPAGKKDDKKGKKCVYLPSNYYKPKQKKQK